MRAILALSALALLPQLQAQACPPPMQGTLKTVVRYIPAENWGDFGKHVEAHLKFLADGIVSGAIQYAGPFLHEEDVAGGMMIVNSTDLKAVSELIQGDELVREKVVSYEINSWMECSIQK